MDPFIKDDQNAQSNDSLPEKGLKASPEPHPGSVLALSVASAVWYFWLSYKALIAKDITRWVWLLCFCFSCLTLSFNAAEQVQLLINFYPASKNNQALTTTRKQAHQKIFLINALAFPIGLFTFVLSTDYSANFDKEAKRLLLGIGSMIFVPYVVVIGLGATDLE